MEEKKEEIIPKKKKENDRSKIVSLIGMILTLVYIALAIACLVLACLCFHTLYATWSEGPWKAIGPCAVAVATTAIFAGLIGLGAFGTQSVGLIRFYAIIGILSLLFSWAISIFALVGARIHYKVDGTVGCQTKKTGILKMWENVDVYLQYADSILCSSQCKCPLPNAVMEEYRNDRFAQNTYETWEKERNELLDDFTLSDCKAGLNKRYRFNFDSCSGFAKNEAHQRYIENSNSTHHWIKPKQFASYWKRLENKFNCTGWCKTKYNDPYTGEDKSMFKFIFSDINRGIPQFAGCMYVVMGWLFKMLLSFGILLIVAALLQTIALLFALKLFASLPPPQKEFQDIGGHP